MQLQDIIEVINNLLEFGDIGDQKKMSILGLDAIYRNATQEVKFAYANFNRDRLNTGSDYITVTKDSEYYIYTKTAGEKNKLLELRSR